MENENTKASRDCLLPGDKENKSRTAYTRRCKNITDHTRIKFCKGWHGEETEWKKEKGRTDRLGLQF